MKMNEKNTRLAVVHTFFNVFNVHQLADAVVDELNRDDGAELHSAKQSGFTIRCKKDTEVSKDDVRKAIADAMSSMMEESLDEILDIMADNYDIAFELDMVTTDLVKGAFDISHNGRLIIVEIDM